MRLPERTFYLLLSLILLFGHSIGSAHAQDPAPFANCRLGVGGAYAPYVGDFDIAQLNVGRYLDWSTNIDPHSSLGLPQPVEYVQAVNVHQDKVGGWDSDYAYPPSYSVNPSLARIREIAGSRPGSLWLIGNEIERRDWNGGGQNEITPELYAVAFHDVRDAIKTTDPTARIGIGSVIEATPLRLAYLDRVWDAYFSRYGYSMGRDIDVWNIHSFILREVRHDWGAEIPAGFDNEDTDSSNDFDPGDGFLYGASTATVIAEHHNIQRFQEFTLALRRWMAAHGERNKPLLNTEYGILYSERNGFVITPAQVNAYLTASLDYLLTATDAQIGYPLDENRLVQGWFWYSLNDDGWNGNLFDPDTKALTTFGATWKNYVSDPAHSLASRPQHNLAVANLGATPNPAVVSPGQATTVTLLAEVSNSGNSRTATGNDIQVSFWDGHPANPASTQIGATQIIDDLPGCSGFAAVKVDWPGRTAGDHVWYARVEPTTGDTDVSDNIAGSLVSVVEVTPVADLGLTKTVDDGAPYTGQSVRYRVALTNHGPDAAFNIVVNDPLPAGLTFNSYVATQGTYFSAGPWAVGTLASGVPAVLTITATVDAGQGGRLIANSAAFTAGVEDRNPSNNVARIDMIPAANANLGLLLTIDESTSHEIVYTVVVINHGPDAAEGITVNHLPPAGLSFDSYTSTQGSYSGSSGLWAVGALSNSASASMTITTKLDAGQAGNSFTITASVSADRDDLEPHNNSASALADTARQTYLPILLKSATLRQTR
jgi:uncharacterized repeat protein (TIGR01451 family)